MKKHLILLAIPLLLLLVSACGTTSDVPTVTVPGGDPVRGQGALLAYGCESCHTIPGISGTRATVGPPLTAFARRRYVAGKLANTPDNLIKWIMEPQSIQPGSVMPNLNVTEQAARDIASYLYTMK